MTSAWTEILISFLVGVVIPAILHKFNLKVPVIVPAPSTPTPDPAVPVPTPAGGIVDELLRRVLDRVLASRLGDAQPAGATLAPQDAELRKLEMIERLLAPPSTPK